MRYIGNAITAAMYPPPPRRLWLWRGDASGHWRKYFELATSDHKWSSKRIGSVVAIRELEVEEI